MNDTSFKPTIYLNRIELDGNTYIKLYYKPNEKILHRIKQNDWIKYSVEVSSWYVKNSKKYIGLVKELFSDIAEVSTKYLEWKQWTQPRISENNIGLDYYNKPPLEKRDTLPCITLFPYEKEGKKLIGFKRLFKNQR